ncbi:D-methionine ABC transporter permease protein MetI [Thermoclostridium stercorarium subsp. stercorarium DSM 8532]|uniref:D-methionine ABC transporter permease protein MetI n=3 Tax=Thermoclostridium stercorarium TaxID=1510 RepID=L7VNG4_THES1|nr:methionine ABC transporter permease [Thermoclostridium stercorarium]AGC67078.1 D-methionine ABC transporter permease protein MetI [Thermoclostridium stercorarium subsp. stercorarium DSM 8532]AGI38161.1 ABC transporter permease subunit [Thermoclostridium stercorarium subsp. stercorarium DSM 8532]UZQ85685.1 ABC transporter permease [Thermoclostridium stercorarium]
MFDRGMLELLGMGILETLYMTVGSTALAYAFGLPLGVLLYVTDKDGIYPIPAVNKILGFIINFLRSVPFLILLVFLIPLTRAIVGTTIGSTATIVPLVIAASPFVARMVESSLKEVDGGVIEAAQSMGSTTFQIIYKVLLPEAKPSLIIGAAITITTILGYSAMAGFVGGGGLGTIAVNYGYYRYQRDVMAVTVVLLVIIVQIFQEVGMRIAKHSDKRIK